MALPSGTVVARERGMLRITTHANGTADRHLVLEGRLTGAWVGELRRIVREGAAGRRRFSLDLSAVTYVDADGLALLRELLGGSADLQRASAFVTALLGDPR